MKWCLLLLMAGSVHAADWPPAVEALRPSIQSAERRLQDASLQLEAARHAAEPLQDEVAAARLKANTWWGSWLLTRRLGQLKTSLDAVETARAAQASARQDLALLLTGADEELSGALEASLASNANKGAAVVERWRAWWHQKRTWQQRLLALDPASDAQAAPGKEPQRIRQEALLAQAERERALVEALHRRRALTDAEWKAEGARLRGADKSGP